MKKASLFASAVTVSGLLMAALPAVAQTPFQDVPADHWAYKSVDTLQRKKIVEGYPDGTYGGKRAMTRYEFAVAIARLLDQIPPATPAPDLTPYVKRDELADFARKSDLAGFAKASDVEELRKLIREFETELTTLGVDVDALKKRVDALEGRVKKIEDELKRVQISGEFNFMARGNNRFDDANSIIDQDGYAVTGGYGSRGGILADTRVFHDLDLNIKARLSDTATAEAKINFGNYLDFLGSIGTYSGARSNRAPIGSFPGQTVNQNQDQSVIYANVKAPISLPGIGGIDLTVGRLPLQLTNYTMKLIDVDQYFFTSKTDLGDVPVDGVKGTFKLGPVGFTAFAAKTDPIKYLSNTSGAIDGAGNYGMYAGAGRSPYATYSGPVAQNSPFTAGDNDIRLGNNGGFRGNSVATTDFAGNGTVTGNRPVQNSIRPDKNGAMAVEQLAGVRASFGNARYGTVGATYIAFAGNSASPVPTVDPLNPDASPEGRLFDRQNRAYFDRVFLYGVDVNTNVVGIGLTGSYTITDTAGPTLVPGSVNGGNPLIDTDTSSKTTRNNYAWDVAGNYARGNFSITGGYREVMPFFGAPGSWTRVGAYTNPTDIKGPYVNGQYNLSSRVALVAGGQFYQGTGKAANDFGGLTTDDKIQNLKAGIKFGLTSASNVDLGIERTEYNVLSASTGGRGKPLEYFYNIGYGYSFNPSSSFKLLYQIVDYRDKNTGFDTQNGMGGIAAAQFSVKF